MAKVPLLDEEEGYRPKSSSGWGSGMSSWTHRIMAQMAGKDELTFAICKATEAYGTAPKEKYLSYIVSISDQDPNVVEEVFLRLSAMTDWSGSPQVTCKVLLVVHTIIQKLDRYYNKHQSAVIFLNEIKDHWQRKEGFLVDYALALLHRILMDVEHPALSTTIYDKQSLLAVNPAHTLRGYSIGDITLFVTNLLSYLERLSLLSSPTYSLPSSAYSSGHSPSSSSSSYQTYAHAKSFVQTECLGLIAVAGYLLQYIGGQEQGQGIGGDGGGKTLTLSLIAQLDVLRGKFRLSPLSHSSTSPSSKSSGRSPYQWN